MSMSLKNDCKVAILGGGFGGLYTALNLAKLSKLPERNFGKIEITLIDTNDRFVFLPLLYELVTGELKDWEVAPVFTDLLAGTGIRFLQGQVSTSVLCRSAKSVRSSSSAC